MADRTITNLAAAGALTGSELVETVQSGNGRKTTTQAIANLAPATNPAGSGTELQFRASASAFGALGSSSVSGSTLTLGGTTDVSSGTLTLANDQISGDKIDGGTISNFASTGIDDNAAGTALTIDGSNNVGIKTAAPTSALHVNGDSFLQGGVRMRRVGTAISANTDDEVFIGVTDTGAPRTITLSTADVQAGRTIIIKDESGGAAANNITIDTEGAETIDGAASVAITANYGVLRVYSDGSNWFSF